MNIEEVFERVDKEVFERIFEVRKIELNLKNYERFPEFQKQKIIFIKDKILETEAIFNFSRKKRPQPSQDANFFKEENDPFCDPYNLTPVDEIGRLENESAITAANLSKMADYHSLVIFKKHNFQDLSEKDFVFGVSLAKEWFQKIKNFDQEIKTQILIWNYHFRAAASILHPHFQLLAYKEIPQKIEFWQKKFEDYKGKFGSEYLDDYFKIAQKLEIAKELSGLRIWLSLTPFKEKTLFFYGQALESFWQVLEKLIKNNTQTFNIFYLYSSPSIKDFGFFVDRGSIDKVNSDFGTLEIFGLPVVSYDPWELSKLIFS